MPQSQEINSSLIQQWFLEQLNVQEVEEKLKSLGHNKDSITVYLKEFNRLKYAKRQSMGFGLAGIGALLGFISCVLTMVNPVPELINFFLYGLTSIAVLIFFAGFYFIFE
ncbi:MAG: hypothetical protein ACKVQB_11715 [Bacteroidia bacterium]